MVAKLLLVMFLNKNILGQIADNQKKVKNTLTWIIDCVEHFVVHAFSLMQMQGVEICRYILIFQGFRNTADALK